MFRVLALTVLLLCPAVALSQGPKEEEPKKEKAKKEKGKKEAAQPGLPDFEKLLPPDVTPEQREMMRKMYDTMKKHMANMPGGKFPGGGVPGGFPGGGFPGGGLPGGFPGGRGGPGAGLPGGGGFPGMPMMKFAMTSPRLGAAIEPASATLLDQLDLPAKQGIVVRNLKKDAAADKAGLKNHDILVELNGKTVPSQMDAFFKILTDIKTDEKVEAVVIRKGKKVSIKELTLPEAPAFGPPAGFPRPGAFPAPPGGAPNPPADRNPGQGYFKSEHRCLV
jgi:hypothetical protein